VPVLVRNRLLLLFLVCLVHILEGMMGIRGVGAGDLV
jgi:hypothetical protein